MPKFVFQLGWNLSDIAWGFSARLTGLKFLPGCNSLRVIANVVCSGSRAEISARLTGLSFQPRACRISARAEISVRPPGWNFLAINYMANFSPGAMLKTGRETFVGKRFTFTTQALRMLKFIFQPGLKSECDYMRFFSPFDRVTWREFHPGLSFSPANRGWNVHTFFNCFRSHSTTLHRICTKQFFAYLV